MRCVYVDTASDEDEYEDEDAESGEGGEDDSEDEGDDWDELERKTRLEDRDKIAKLRAKGDSDADNMSGDSEEETRPKKRPAPAVNNKAKPTGPPPKTTQVGGVRPPSSGVSRPMQSSTPRPMQPVGAARPAVGGGIRPPAAANARPIASSSSAAGVRPQQTGMKQTTLNNITK